MSTTAYMVIYEHWEDTEVLAVYTTAELAEFHVRLMTRDEARHVRIDPIEVHDLPPVRSDWWDVRCESKGDVLSPFRERQGTLVTPEPFTEHVSSSVIRRRDNAYSFFARAATQARAHELILNEYRKVNTDGYEPN